jgi:CheY-like chemotaxis protein
MQGSTDRKKGLVVMFVDDNEIDNFVNTQLVESAGISAHQIIMQSPLDAIDYLSKPGLELSEVPDLILLDIHMPEMDGFQFLDAFDKLPETVKGKTKVFMLSSSLDAKDMERARENRYVIKTLSKPLEVKEITGYFKSA